MSTIIAIVIGIFLGGIVSKFLFVGSFLNLILWGVIALTIGYFSKNKKYSVLNGALFGFFLSFVFMIVGYDGSRPLIFVIPPFMLLGLFGAFCGGVLGIVGFFKRKLFSKKRR